MNDTKSKNFYRRLRHFERSNWYVLLYSIKSLMCWIKGDTKDMELLRVNELASSKSIDTLPMTVWSYEYCIEFAKLIRKKVLQFDAAITSFDFTSTELFGIYNHMDESVREYFRLVAENCGFNVDVNSNQTIYTITSAY